MVNFKKNIIIFSLFILIFNNNVYCNDNTDISSASQNNPVQFVNNDKIDQVDCFLFGIRDGTILTSILFIPVFCILAVSKDKASDILSKYGKISKIILIDKVNLSYLLSLYIIEPIFITLLDNTIISSNIEAGLSAIMPASLSNKNLYENLPFISNLFSNEFKDHLRVNSTSVMAEILTTFTFANIIMLLVISNDNIYSGIIHALIYILKTSYYKSDGYIGAVSYGAGLNIVLSSSSTLLLMLAYSFIIDINIQS